ncbi:SCO family protein [Calditrichota bacterium]
MRLALILFTLLPILAYSQVVQQDVAELQGIDVEENLGGTIPLDAEVIDHNGNKVLLSSYFDGSKPVLFVLHYSDCPMLCSMVLNGVSNGVRELGFKAGGDYRILSLSVNPHEETERASETWDRYHKTLKVGSTPDAWSFLTADSLTIKEIADSLGFRYYLVEESGQYAHPAVLHVLSPEGKITRYLYGVEFKERDLRLAVVEAGEGKVGTTIDRIILYCFHYDPDANSYTAFAENIMRLGGFVTMFVLGGVIFGLWQRDKRKTAMAQREKALSEQDH